MKKYAFDDFFGKSFAIRLIPSTLEWRHVIVAISSKKCLNKKLEEKKKKKVKEL